MTLNNSIIYIKPLKNSILMNALSKIYYECNFFLLLQDYYYLLKEEFNLITVQ